MTYIFSSSNTSMSIILTADSEEEVWKEIEDTVKPEANDFRLSEVEDD